MNNNSKYVYSTILDGYNQIRPLKVEDCDSISVNGFTIQNGYAQYTGLSLSSAGGGIFCLKSNFLLKNSVIKNNKGNGGGIYIKGEYGTDYKIKLSNNSIHHNSGGIIGGGIAYIDWNENLEFDTENLNSIYMNYAANGADIYSNVYIYGEEPMTIVTVDTFTVMNPKRYHANDFAELEFNINHAYLEPIDADLYVAPWGSDENSGLSESDPLQTIASAQTKILSDSLSMNTIHLAAGTYSVSENNQQFPLNKKNYVKIIGENEEKTILDAELETGLFDNAIGQEWKQNYWLKNLTLKNVYNGGEGSDAVICSAAKHSEFQYFENIIATNCHDNIVFILRSGKTTMKNVKIYDNFGGVGISGFSPFNDEDVPKFADVYMENVLVKNNQPSIMDPESCGGGGILISKAWGQIEDYPTKAVLHNVEISNNNNGWDMPSDDVTSALYIDHFNNITLNNCTITNNESLMPGQAVRINYAKNINFYNSIIWDNMWWEMHLIGDSEVNLTNCQIGPNENTEIIVEDESTLSWNTPNILDDPLFEGTGDYPYQLSTGSPCINAGTTNLPDSILIPEFDLVGNPRIVGNGIDLGAYEYQEVSTDEIGENLQNSLKIYPNPYKIIHRGREQKVKIKSNVVEAGKLEVDIFNIKGQRVVKLMNIETTRSSHEIYWDGKNDSGEFVASGQYLCKMRINKTKLIKKLTVIR